MTCLGLKSILNRTVIMPVRCVIKHEVRLTSNLCNLRRTLISTFCKENSLPIGKRVISRLFSITLKNNVKFFAEKENEFAHVVMESNPAYSGRLFRKDSLESKPLSDGDYVKHTAHDWSSSPPSELLSAFADVTGYALTHSKQITDPELNNICRAVAERCVEFSDRELMSCLECLTHWPEAESLNSVNFVDLWSALDKACLSRVKAWDVGTLLYVADVWYTLHLSRLSKYVGECIWRLGRKVKHLSSQELVQCMFYMNTSRKFKVPSSLYEFEFYVEQCIQHLSVDELAIVAMGFFKSKTPIRSPHVVSCMLQKTADEIDSVDEVSLCSLMKLFRYCLPMPLVDDLYDLLDKTVANVDRLSLFCCVQIALAGTPTQVFHRRLIDVVVERFVKELSTSRLKDIERMIFVVTLYDHVPDCVPDFFEKVTEEIQSRASSSESRQYPKNLAYCLNYLSLREIYPVELVDKVLSEEFIEETYGRKNLHVLGRELLCLDVGAEIECPDYRGNRLGRKARNFLAKRYTEWIPSRTKKHLSLTGRLFLEVLEATEELVGRECVYADIVTPNFALTDIVVGVDGDGAAIPVAGMFSSYRLEDVKYPPRRRESDRWVVFVVGGVNMFVRNENLPLGTTTARLRQLRKVGYLPVLVPWFEFTKIAASERPNFIRQKISSTCGL